ncbi:MAG: aldehyde:ferredoxin oxidoreductase [Candidatus Hydrogenedentes bacterium]|nr:aldehyde:ferredoxin oxidoreductase [Candidatus Hydrogenedentota bacterium]
MNGYAGKILRLDLTKRKVMTIPTSDYEQWGGGHGMGSAIFFDLVKDKTIDGFDPANVVTLMTSPLCGTLVPSAGGRTEVQGIGVQSYPIGWFTRSNFGGRFSSQLKYAGWDGVVIEGRADEPVWIDIRDGSVQIRNCADLGLWGKDTQDCQERIWDFVGGNDTYGDWLGPTGKDGGQTTQRSAIVAIGPAGENLCRTGCLIHDAGNGSGQGGFGGVWGSKNLKAISAIGTGAIGIHDPKALLKARIWQKKHYGFDLENPYRAHNKYDGAPWPLTFFGDERTRSRRHRPQSCVGCHAACRGRYEDGLANEIICENSLFYGAADSPDIKRRACKMLNDLGLNALELQHSVVYLEALHKSGAFGPGTGIDCPLDFDKYGTLDFAEQFMKMIAYRNDGRGNPSEFGEDMGDGIMRAAQKWGKLDGFSGGTKDLLQTLFPFWGLPVHRDPRRSLIWGYGSVLGDRDINEHCFDAMHRGEPEEMVRILTNKMVPFQDDPLMLDFSDEGMYSEHMAKLISWHRYYTRFYKQSLLFCDTRWPDFVNLRAPDKIGLTGDAEPKFLKAVTGKNLTFLEGIEVGKKIWNLDHAIWTLQGRHRDMVHFTDIHYEQAGSPGRFPGIKDGKWERIMFRGRRFDKDRFEEFKTRFYELQGWDTASGFPTRSTLAGMGLDHVADELEAQGTLGA